MAARPVAAAVLLAAAAPRALGMGREERIELREAARGLFTHGYDAYMAHAFPRDVLKPLSCTGADGWGSISLTLIDTLDTLALMNNATEFARAVSWCVDHVSFDVDETVSLFETTIRALGGLLSAHLLASDRTLGLMDATPYDPRAGLLALAVDLADRLMPALNTSTGIPYGSVNLRRGVDAAESPIACTAAAGTLALEFGALSALTRDGRYAAAAQRAAFAVWRRRSTKDLLGAHVHLESGAWTQADSGIGRGIDSFYEYMLKAHLLLGGDGYLAVFHDAYHAALAHLHRAPWYVDAHLASGQVTWPLFNSLQCFWPGMQSMIGETELAIETLRAFHSLWRHLGYHPEGFNLHDLAIQTGQEGYPLRPEHAESLFYVHRATGADEWLRAGADVLASLQRLRVPCGIAALSDVANRTPEDAMESFFLSETAKYLFLLFDPDDEVYEHGRRAAHPADARARGVAGAPSCRARVAPRLYGEPGHVAGTSSRPRRTRSPSTSLSSAKVASDGSAGRRRMTPRRSPTPSLSSGMRRRRATRRCSRGRARCPVSRRAAPRADPLPPRRACRVMSLSSVNPPTRTARWGYPTQCLDF